MALWSVLFPRPARTPLVTRPSLTLYFLLAGAFLLTLVPHFMQFPIWVTVAVVGAMVLRSFVEFYRLPLPSTTFCGIVAIIFCGAVFAQFRAVVGRDPGTAFTAGLLAIKFYELRRPRDVALIIFSCFFMVMSALLYSQALELFIYCLIMMWVLTALLLRVHTGDLPEDRLLRMLRRSGIIFLQAVPLALFLFIFFPRYTGQLSLTWYEPSVGLTDTLAPGSIAKLSQNDSEAMYVRFTSGTPPTPDTMYWRGLVLWEYKGGIWTPGLAAYAEPHTKAAAAPGSTPIDQEITIKPHYQKWLFALDAPVSPAIDKAELPSGVTILNGDVLQLTSNRLDHMARYTVSSATTLADTELSQGEKFSGTQLPEIDPRVRQLADRLHEGLSDGQEQAYIGAVLHYFRSQHFVYSTEPGEQGTDWLPVFLFQTKIGFCEHYASAFAVLMRLEHIPARVVVGYQGADYNPYAENYIVSQSNAHAWDEVWIEAKKRWVRFDPTALLAAGENGALANRSGNGGDTLSLQVAHHKLTFSEAYLPAWVKDSLKEMQLRREQVETGWDNVVLSYDPEAQSRLAHALGFGQKAPYALLAVCAAAAVICLVFFQRWIARKPAIPPVESIYAAFCRKMSQRGIPRSTWEGPLAYTGRVAEAFPDNELAIRRVGSIVAEARYGPLPPDPATPDQLQSLLTLITTSPVATASR